MKMSEKQKKIAYWTCFLLLLAVLVFLCFFKLTAKYVDPWDEARHGVNALEMLRGGSVIQNTYLRQADYYNLKPPLSMWCIMVGLKLFPDPVLALRFYSALCYVLLALITSLAVRKISDTASLFTLAALSINMTPFLAHMVRAGDADSLYCLLFTAAMLAMMRIRQNHRFLYLCGFLFSLAFLTKSFHALTIAAIGGLFLILTRQLTEISLKEWLCFILCTALPVLIWVCLRYRIDGTTFFVKMWETDVLGRTGGELHSNPTPFWYYLEYYFTPVIMGKMQVYTWALAVTAAAGILRCAERVRGGHSAVREQAAEEKKDGIIRLHSDQIIALTLWILVPFLAFSAVSNKLLWYVYPAVTGLMVLAGISCGILLSRLANLPEKKIRRAAAGLFLAATVCCYCWYAAGIWHITNAQGYNEFQILIRALAGEDKAISVMEEMASGDDRVTVPKTGYQNCRIYVDHENGNAIWAQQDVFVAEAFGNYDCRDGGIMEILASPSHEEQKGLILVQRQTYEVLALLYDDCTLVAQSPEYLALEVEY